MTYAIPVNATPKPEHMSPDSLADVARVATADLLTRVAARFRITPPNQDGWPVSADGALVCLVRAMWLESGQSDDLTASAIDAMVTYLGLADQDALGDWNDRTDPAAIVRVVEAVASNLRHTSAAA